MKAAATLAIVCALVGSAAAAGEMRGPGGGGDRHGGGWGANSGVFVDVPWSAIDNGNNSGIPPRSDYEIRCRDARHSCFGQFGVNEPGYGQCMVSRGC